MKIALFGHGAMGRRVRACAEAEGHEIGLVVTSWAGDHGFGTIQSALEGHDVAIDFSAPEAVLRNAEVCAVADVPLVEGTTGWDSSFYAVREVVRDLDGTFVFGSNFSTGSTVFLQLVERAAEIFAAIEAYYPDPEAGDNPADSGIGLFLGRLLEERIGRSIAASGIATPPSLDDQDDEIAAGALLAARWAIGKRGFFPFAEVIGDILLETRPRPWHRPALAPEAPRLHI